MATARFLLNKLGSLVITLLVASAVIYGALYLAPGDPATLLAGGHATPSILAEIHRQYHLDDPLWVRYWSWLTAFVQGDLGQSFVYREPIALLLSARVGNTVFLVAYASVVILLAGIGLGLVGALAKRLGTVVTIGLSVGLATPSFVVAIIFIAVFAVDLGWFPVFGTGTRFVDQLWHLTLPAFALALSWTAYVAQITRTAVREEVGREHVETARSRGLPERYVVRRHVLRNALIPITTVSGLSVAGLIAGDVVVEQAFGINGLGSFLVQAVSQKDFAVVQAISLILVAIFVIVNVTVDLLNSVLDPRLRQVRAR